MEIKPTAEVTKDVTDFANRLLNLLKDKKAIDQDIKTLKEEYKENGVAVGVVAKAINKIKSDMKKTDSERFEEDAIQEMLEQNKDVMDGVSDLVAK